MYWLRTLQRQPFFLSGAFARGRCRDSTSMSAADAASSAPSGTHLSYARLSSHSLIVHVCLGDDVR
jgi:hypothetical protein